MGDLLGTGSKWLTAQRHANMTVDVTYTTGSGSVTLKATVGASNTAEVLDGQVVNASREADFLIRAVDLVVASLAVIPARGHRISRVVNGKRYFYSVTPTENDQCWRWADSEHEVYRVHTKADGSETA